MINLFSIVYTTVESCWPGLDKDCRDTDLVNAHVSSPICLIIPLLTSGTDVAPASTCMQPSGHLLFQALASRAFWYLCSLGVVATTLPPSNEPKRLKQMCNSSSSAFMVHTYMHVQERMVTLSPTTCVAKDNIQKCPGLHCLETQTTLWTLQNAFVNVWHIDRVSS